jgi:hypothetical protein
MANTRRDLLESSSILGQNLSNIGKQIKENKINSRKEKILEGFANPEKIFFNADGSTKDPIETRNKITGGALELLMLGDTTMANGLLNFYSEQEKTLTKRATNSAYRNILGDKGKVLDGADADRVDTTKFAGTLNPKDMSAGKRQWTSKESQPFQYKDEDGSVRWVRHYKEVNPLTGATILEEYRDVNNPSIKYNFNNSKSSTYTYHAGEESFAPAQITLPDGSVVSGFTGNKGTILDAGKNKVNSKDVKVDFKYGTDTQDAPQTGFETRQKRTKEILDTYGKDADKKKQIIDYLSTGKLPSWWNNPDAKPLRDELFNIYKKEYQYKD